MRRAAVLLVGLPRPARSVLLVDDVMGVVHLLQVGIGSKPRYVTLP